jgi:Flp pilus assembly pilin Flp
MSGFLQINWLDVGKGFLIAFGTVFLLGVVNVLETGTFPTLAELGALAVAGLAAGLTYVLKNFFTNSGNKLAEKDTK